MKLKGITTAEQHAEKGLLAIAGIAFAGVVAAQFLSSEPVVLVGGREVPQHRAWEALAREAQLRGGQMREPVPDGRVPGAPPALAPGFVSRGAAVVEPLATALVFGIEHSGGGDGDATVAATRVGPMGLPAPFAVMAEFYAAALDPVVVAGSEQLRKIAPAEQPFDVRTVTVRADIDAAALRAVFEADPDGPGGECTPVPSLWWGDKLFVSSLDLERRRQSPDGSWSAPEPVPAAPCVAGRVVAPPVGADVPSRAVRSFVRALREDSASGVHAYARPLFYGSIAGEPWLPPGAASGDEAKALQVAPSDLAVVDGSAPAWAFDVTVDPGAVYSYRARYTVPNPLFSFRGSLAPESAAAGDSPVLTSAWSAWSEPVAVDAQEYWFVTRVGDGQGVTSALGDGRAWCDVEMYGFYYGYWRRSRARLRPGDAVRAVFDPSEPGLVSWSLEAQPPVGSGVGSQAPASLGASTGLTAPVPLGTGQVFLGVVPGPEPADRGRRRAWDSVFSAVDGAGVQRTSEAGATRLRSRLASSVDEGLRAAEGASE